MSKKKGIEKFANSVTKEIINEQGKELKELEKIKKQYEKDYYINSRYKEVENKNLEIDSKIKDLNNIIIDEIANYKYISIEDYIKKDIKKLEISEELLIETKKPIKSEIRKTYIFEKLFKTYKANYIKYRDYIEETYNNEINFYKKIEEERKSKISREKEIYNFEVKNIINSKKNLYHLGDIDLISEYKKYILERSNYRFEFNKNIQIGYDNISKTLVIEYDFPKIDIVPKIECYEYKAKLDEIRPIQRKEKDIKNIYNDVIMSITIKTIYEVINSDISMDIKKIVFNGYIYVVDLSTGKDKRPCIVSLISYKEQFNSIEFSRIGKYEFLKSIGASISIDAKSNLKEIIPMYNYDFVSKKANEISNINLLKIDPFEFEGLVSDLFRKMGYNTVCTKCTNDGGVDFQFYYNVPIVSGNILAQVKRYKNNIDIPKLREFESVVRNENAMKGIFITTSDFSQQCINFASERNIELINGEKLIKMFKEQHINNYVIDYN